MKGLKGRRELKHSITKADCYLLRNNLQHFMTLDPHGNEGKYLIRSVYFDNFDNRIMTQKTEAIIIAINLGSDCMTIILTLSI